MRGLREQHPSEDKTRHDLQYMLHPSLLKDIALLIETIWTLTARLVSLPGHAQFQAQNPGAGRATVALVFARAPSLFRRYYSMLIGRSPVRISFGGGGTDLPSYYEQFGGAVLSTAINKYFYTILGNRSDGRSPSHLLRPAAVRQLERSRRSSRPARG